MYNQSIHTAPSFVVRWQIALWQ